MKLALVLLSIVALTQARNNGLALTPPMGWLSWTRFGCNVGYCYFETLLKNGSNKSFFLSEDLLKTQAKAMASLGYKDAGYQYIIVGDCWLDKTRDPLTNKLRPNPNHFPNGMKPVIDYVTNKWLFKRSF